MIFHGLRHSHKTWMIADGIPEIAHALRLGHALEDKVQETYSHVATEVETRLLESLQERWDKALADVGEALSAVPGLQLPDDWEEQVVDAPLAIKVNGRVQTINVYWAHGDPGGLIVQLNQEAISLEIGYNADAWMGGRDGDYMEPPYSLISKGSEQLALDPA